MATMTPEQAQADKARRAAEAAQRKRQGELAEATAALYRLPAGRTFLIWLLEVGRALGQNPYRGEAAATAFACGEMNVGLQIMAQLIQTSPDSFASLLKETSNARPRAAQQPDPAGEPSEPDSASQSSEPVQPASYS